MFVLFSFRCWAIFRSFVKASPSYFIFFLTAYILLPTVIFEVSILLFLLSNISTPRFLYIIFKCHLLHTYSSTVSIFSSWSMSELVMVISSINNSDDIIRYPNLIPNPSALSSTPTSSASAPNSDSTFPCLVPFSNLISFVVLYFVFIVVTWSWHKLYIVLHILPLTSLCLRL